MATRDREYPERPWVAVGIIVFRGDRVLLVRRGAPPAFGEWSIPGGAQHLGETAKAAALRELREETGVVVDDMIVAATADIIDTDAADGVRFHYTIIDFAAWWSSGEPVAGGDVSDAQWFSSSELPALLLRPAVLQAIDEAWFRLGARPQRNRRSFSRPV